MALFIKNKKVSIVVPIYNTEKYLDRCLTSIINQTHKNLEIILVNDGSSDNSLAIMNKYKDMDNRIIIINQENQGAGEARNTGLKIATGDYISFIDSDDYIDVTYVSELLKAIKKNDAYSYCNVLIKDKVKEISELENYLFMNQMTGGKLCNLKYVRGIAFPKYHYCDDLMFYYKLLSSERSCTKVNKPLYIYEQRNDSLSHSRKDYPDELIDILNDIYNYKDIKKMSLKYQERVEFLFVWTGLFGNFRRTFQSGMKFDEEYVKTYLDLVNNYFPNWYKNKYLDTFIWDKDILELLISKDYSKIVNIYKEKYEVNTNKINNPKD